MSQHEVTVLFLALAALLGLGRVLGEVAKLMHQPGVLGEILAGIVLGPTILGHVSPEAMQWLFPSTGPVAITLQGFGTVGVALFLLVAGMEVDLPTVRRRGRAATGVSLLGIAVPFGLGVFVVFDTPELFGAKALEAPIGFALFFGTALGISALPVIARTLMDLGLFRTDVGMVTIAAAVVDDILGWTIFGIVLGLLGAEAEGLHPGLMVAFALGFALFMLTIGRFLVRAAMPWVLAFTSWPGGVIGFATLGAFLCAALTEWIGIHALFGAFFWGIALGDTPHFRKDTRRILEGFIAFVFAPVFFATIGLRVDFVAHFDLKLVGIVLAVACVGKIAGAGLGAKLSGMSWRESSAVGFAMNARGAMEIVLGLTALQQGLIDERIFVALVVMALVTSMISGPVMQRLMRRGKKWSFTDWVSVDTFVSPLEVSSAGEAIKRLSYVTAAAAGLPGDSVEEAVLAREAMMPTGLAHGIAVPHARISGLTRPWVGIGVLADGADFGALDDQPAHLVILLLTPEDDRSAIQLELLADIAGAFHDETAAAYAKDAKSLTEFLAAVRTAERPGGAHR